MSDDIRLSVGFFSHRKTKRLRRMLGDAGVVGLLALWAWAGRERWTGDLAGLTDDDLEDSADWAGEPGALIQVLADPRIRFIDGPPGERCLHDWAEHQAYAIHRGTRHAKAKAAATARWAKHRAEQAERQPELALEGVNSPPDAPSIGSDAQSNALEQCPPTPTPTPTKSKSECARAAEAESTAEALALAGCPDATAGTVADAIASGIPGTTLAQHASTAKGRGKPLAYLLTWIRGATATTPDPVPLRPAVAGTPPSVIDARKAGESLRAKPPEQVSAVLQRARAELGRPFPQGPPPVQEIVPVVETGRADSRPPATGGR